jgi:hypothetical protein
LSRTRRLLMAALAFTLAVTGLGAIAPSTAFAGTGLIFNVVDADNDPYSGLYLRDATNMASANRVQHRYMLYGTEVELICFSEGESVPPHNNRLWHKVYVRNNHAAGQTGWVADRYLNTPIKANERVNGEPDCNANIPPPAPGPVPNTRGAVYYSPFEKGSYEPGDTTINIAKSVWSAGSGCANSVGNTPTYNSNSRRSVTSLAGWSLGRLGPVSRVKQIPGNIDYMLLIDPGSLRELNGCDRELKAGDALYNWLNSNKNARLVILAGSVTRDIDTKVGNYAHQGIQQVYFPRLRSSGISSRVMVCNYDYGHETMFTKFRNRIDDNPLTSCPEGKTPWHP